MSKITPGIALIDIRITWPKSFHPKQTHLQARGLKVTLKDRGVARDIASLIKHYLINTLSLEEEK